jgi:hypothetical protein
MPDITVVAAYIAAVRSQVVIIVTQVAPVISGCGVIVLIPIIAQLAPVAIDFVRVVPYVSSVFVALSKISSAIAVVMVILRHHAARTGKNHEHKARQKSFHTEILLGKRNCLPDINPRKIPGLRKKRAVKKLIAKIPQRGPIEGKQRGNREAERIFTYFIRFQNRNQPILPAIIVLLFQT